MKKIVTLLLLVSFFFVSCEKDDICDPATQTTPRLVIEFFDYNNRSLIRPVTNLKIIGAGMEDNNGVPNESGSQTWNSAIVNLPLRLNEDVTEYRLILNADDGLETNDRIDTLKFNYRRNEIYVSRACGFKTTFNLSNNATQNAFILNNTPNATQGAWIDSILVLKPQIENENEAHIKIFF